MDKEVDDLTHKKENRTECGTGKKNIRVFKEGDEEQLEKKREREQYTASKEKRNEPELKRM